MVDEHDNILSNETWTKLSSLQNSKTFDCFPFGKGAWVVLRLAAVTMSRHVECVIRYILYMPVSSFVEVLFLEAVL